MYVYSSKGENGVFFTYQSLRLSWQLLRSQVGFTQGINDMGNVSIVIYGSCKFKPCV